jgi:HAD superfamily hydrolase (TIGR01509 family)
LTQKLKAVVLDAMGVIYSIGDDVHGLLCPFIAEKGGSRDIPRIEQFYRSASLGNISAFDFWKAVNVDPELEDEYLQRQTLSDGLLDFLKETRQHGHEIWCLSNDVSEWSKKLRLCFGLGKYITGFVISGDVGLRKPDPAVFHVLVKQSNIDPHNAIFVDDTKRNLDSAANVGFETILFRPVEQDCNRHKMVSDFREIKLLLV